MNKLTSGSWALLGDRFNTTNFNFGAQMDKWSTKTGATARLFNESLGCPCKNYTLKFAKN